MPSSPDSLFYSIALVCCIAIGRLSCCAVAWCLFFSSTALAKQSNPAWSGFLAYLQAIDSVQFTSATSDWTGVAKDSVSNDRPPLVEYWFVSSANQYIYRRTEPPIETNGGAQDAPVRFNESIIGLGNRIELTADAASRTAMQVTSYLRYGVEEWRRDAGFSYLAPALGYVRHSGGYTYISLLAKSADVLAPENSSYNIRIEGDDFSVLIYADSERGWMPTRLKYTSNVRGDERPDRIEYCVDDAIEVSGQWFPARMKCTTHMPASRKKLPDHIRLINGALEVTADPSVGEAEMPVAEATYSAIVELKDARVGLSVSNVPERLARIPDGTEIHMQDAPQLEYVWYEGKAVLRTSDVAAALIDAEFYSLGDGMRGWYLWGNVALVLILAAYVFWYRFWRNYRA